MRIIVAFSSAYDCKSLDSRLRWFESNRPQHRKDEVWRIKDKKGKKQRKGKGKKMQDLLSRTQGFALKIIRLFSNLPKSTEAQVLGKQLLRSGTSVGAHYREGMRARSKAEFVSKIDAGLQELEKSRYWLELLLFSGIAPENQISEVMQEAKELTAIFITISKNTKAQMFPA